MASLFLKNLDLFSDLTPEELEKVADITYQAHYDKNEVLFLEGDPGDAFYIISQGLVKVFTTNENGKEKTLSLLGRKDFFGEMALLDDGTRSASVKAVEDSEVLVIEREKFRELISLNPNISLKIIAVLSQRLRRANSQIQELTFSSVRERLENKLQELAQKYGRKREQAPGVLITKKITHQELADLIGTTRVTTTKILNKLEKEDKILSKERYLIIKDNQLIKGGTDSGN
jgi:CRP/FNR family transcriptional regulator